MKILKIGAALVLLILLFCLIYLYRDKLTANSVNELGTHIVENRKIEATEKNKKENKTEEKNIQSNENNENIKADDNKKVEESDKEDNNQEVNNNSQNNNNNNNFDEESKNRDNITGKDVVYDLIVDESVINSDLRDYAAKSKKGKYIYENIDKLDYYHRKALANNKDMADYIISYINGDRVKYEYGETIPLGRKYPYYIQWDRRWAYDPLGGTEIAIGGCGPTSMAMAISGILKDESITPRVIASIENNAGYYTQWGTADTFYAYISDYYGLDCEQFSPNKATIDRVLNKGYPVLISVVPGKFTTVGHLMLIVGKNDDGTYQINDPNNYGKSLVRWNYEDFSNEIRTCFAISRR